MIEGANKFERRNYTVKAKRKNTDEYWSEWSSADDYEKAVELAQWCTYECGYLSQIVDAETKEILLELGW